MGNKANAPRSFNTIRRSQTKERAKRRQTERVVLLSIFTVIAAIIVASLLLLICNIGSAIASNAGNNHTDETTDSNSGGTNPQIVYQQITKTSNDIFVGELVLVNSSNEYQFPTIPLVTIKTERDKALVNGANPYQVGNDTYQMHETAFTAFHKMMSIYYQMEQDGAVTVTGAYRDYKEQADMSSSIAGPGFSDHHTGYCIALRSNSQGGYLSADHWIYKYCHQYGFIVRYPNDKKDQTGGIEGYEYCFRYVGVPHASYIAKYGLCMEEYIATLQNDYADGECLTINAADGNNYAVYYVPASGAELTTVSVPKNYEYTVSGDNVGGFIVTVNLSAPKE